MSNFINKFPNTSLGRHCNILTSANLMKDKKLSQYVNNATMGALDNYAQHNKLRIYITPLENDLFDDLSVDIFHKKWSSTYNDKFAMKIKDGKHSVADFITDLHKEVVKIVQKNPEIAKDANNKKNTYRKLSKFEEFKMWAKNVSDRIHDYKIEVMKNFIDKNENKTGIKKAFADALEDIHSDELYR